MHPKHGVVWYPSLSVPGLIEQPERLNPILLNRKVPDYPDLALYAPIRAFAAPPCAKKGCQEGRMGLVQGAP